MSKLFDKNIIYNFDGILFKIKEEQSKDESKLKNSESNNNLIKKVDSKDNVQLVKKHDLEKEKFCYKSIVYM